MFKEMSKWYFLIVMYTCVIIALSAKDVAVTWQLALLIAGASVCGVLECQSILRKMHEWSHEDVQQFKCLNMTYFFGSEKAFLARWCTESNDMRECILGVAIKHPDGVIYVALAPLRHHHIVRAMDSLGKAGIENTREGGFITNLGRYVSRREGMYIARNAKQLLPFESNSRQPTHLLYSEDVWD